MEFMSLEESLRCSSHNRKNSRSKQFLSYGLLFQ